MGESQNEMSRRSVFIASSSVIMIIVSIMIMMQITRLPNGPAVHVDIGDRPKFLPIDYSNKSLRDPKRLKKIIERIGESGETILRGPETVVFDQHGTMFILTEDALLVKLTDFIDDPVDSMIISAKAEVVVDLGVGRPLGGKFASDGSLYIADTLLGLTRVTFPKIEGKGAKPVVELVSSRVTSDKSKILYADDVDIGPKTGFIYFSDASTVAPERTDTKHWDTLQASKIHCMKGEKSGRILRYNPTTDEVDVLVAGINFANGIAVEKDEKYVLISETFGSRVLKYNLEGEMKGQTEVIVSQLPSFPDGAACSLDSGLCYVPIPSGPVGIVKILFSLPTFIERPLRSFLMILPKSVQPPVVKYGGVVEFHPGNETTHPHVIQIFQDPTGEVIKMLTGVTIQGGKLYLGSLENDYVGVFDLQQP